MESPESLNPTPPPTAWNIKLLGRLEVTSADGEAPKFSSRTALSLLAYLSLTKDREHANESLYELFWPDSDGDRQAQNLRRAIADLRKVLEQDLPLGSVIVTRRGSVSLNSDRVATDVERFLDLVRHETHAEGLTRLAEAIDLYSGPLLAPLTEKWLTGHRMELEEFYGQTVERLCEILIEQGSVKEAINVGRAAAVLAPSREDVHIALIHAYRCAGMGVEALRQFEELERILDETWGEVPSARAREALEAAFAVNKPRQHNLPEQLTSFIGREKEIEEVCELLSKTRLLTLTGSGGCGKTRLSLQAATRVLCQFPDGVWFVEFAPLVDPELVPNAVAAALGLAEQSSRSHSQTLLDYLRAKRLLLVLDNCEHLLLACAQLAEAVLRQCPSVVVLANSREGFAIGGELLYRVPSLSLPDPKEPQTTESLSQNESVQLFIARADQVQRGFSATTQNAFTLASVCRRLDGIPLAIELAAARMRSMSAEELSERLDDRFRLLTGGSRTALPRQQTLRSLIDWSYDLLNDAEKALFCRLAVFAGGCVLESAEKVCAGTPVEESATLDLLTSLCDKNLVVPEQVDGITRYGMLETVRQYARDLLLESGEGEELRDRHLAHFLALAEEAEPYLIGREQQAWLTRLEADHDNLRAALEWTSAAGEDSAARLRLAGALQRFWYVRGHLSEGRQWFANLLASDTSVRVTAARGKALFGAGLLAWAQGYFSEALAFYEESLSIRRELGDQWGIATSIQGLVNLTCLRGDFVAARMLADEGLTIRRELGDQLGIVMSLISLGGLEAVIQGNFHAARSLFKQSHSISLELGAPDGIAQSLNGLGMISYLQGEYLDAQALLEESLRIFQALGDRQRIASSLTWLAKVALELGHYASSRALFEEGLETRRELGACGSIPDSLEGVASFWTVLADPFRAARLLGAAEELREETSQTLAPVERARYELLVAAIREALANDEAFDRAWQEGRAMTLEQAIELALEGSDS